jgi:hypothetical protein
MRLVTAPTRRLSPAAWIRSAWAAASVYLRQVIPRFAHRLVVSACAGATLIGVTTGGWLIAQRLGLAEKSSGNSTGQSGEPTPQQIVALACATGAFLGAGYGFVRPVLPRKPELAGLIYAFAQGVAVRAQLTALFKLLRREKRFIVSRSRLTGEVILGLWLARAERLLGPPA